MRNQYSEIISKLRKELHYTNSQMRKHFPLLFKLEEQENLRLVRRRARILRFKLIGA